MVLSSDGTVPTESSARTWGIFNNDADLNLTPLQAFFALVPPYPTHLCNRLGRVIAEITHQEVKVYYHLASQLPSITDAQNFTITVGTYHYGSLFVKHDAAVAAASMRQLANHCGTLLAHIETQAYHAFAHRNRIPQGNCHAPTSGERSVLHLLHAGYRPAAIAAQLGISVGTANKHLSNVYSKLAAHSVAEALAAGRHAGVFLFVGPQ